MKAESPRTQLDALGQYIRSQRKNAELSLRELAEKTGVSNPYLSQLERGLHEPSMRVLSAIAEALEVSIETLLSRAGLLRNDDGGTGGDHLPATPAAIAGDPALTDDQKAALLAVYKSYVEGNNASGILAATAAAGEPNPKTSDLSRSKTKPAIQPKPKATTKPAAKAKTKATAKSGTKSGTKNAAASRKPKAPKTTRPKS